MLIYVSNVGDRLATVSPDAGLHAAFLKRVRHIEFSHDLTIVLCEGETSSTKLFGVEDKCAQCYVTPARVSV